MRIEVANTPPPPPPLLVLVLLGSQVLPYNRGDEVRLNSSAASTTTASFHRRLPTKSPLLCLISTQHGRTCSQQRREGEALGATSLRCGASPQCFTLKKKNKKQHNKERRRTTVQRLRRPLMELKLMNTNAAGGEPRRSHGAILTFSPARRN